MTKYETDNIKQKVKDQSTQGLHLALHVLETKEINRAADQRIYQSTKADRLKRLYVQQELNRRRGIVVYCLNSLDSVSKTA